MADPAFHLYARLLKRSLTNTLFAPEPDADQPSEGRFVQQFLSHYIEGPAISMLPLVRFDNLQACLEAVVADGIDGDVIETGVWRGGATIFMRGILKALGDDRTVWAADSFEGLPEPDPELYPREAKSFHGPVMARGYDRLAAGIEQVKANFVAYGLLDQRVQFLQGWFKDTLPTAPIRRLALMRLDGDYYESTRDALANLYKRLSCGGFVIVDDYGEESWTYCKRAVDEFRAEREIEAPLIRVDSKCYFWRKSA